MTETTLLQFDPSSSISASKPEGERAKQGQGKGSKPQPLAKLADLGASTCEEASN
jgi:hypothetical protein